MAKWTAISVPKELYRKFTDKAQRAGFGSVLNPYWKYIERLLESTVTASDSRHPKPHSDHKSKTRHPSSRPKGVGVGVLTPQQQKEQDDLERAVTEVERRRAKGGSN